jgi:CRISPR-associated protein Cas2
MLILVSYDVPDDRRRTRLAHALKDFGERVQYSVFECRLDERAQQTCGSGSPA